jgi:hypothetical protein
MKDPFAVSCCKTFRVQYATFVTTDWDKQVENNICQTPVLTLTR